MRTAVGAGAAVVAFLLTACSGASGTASTSVDASSSSAAANHSDMAMPGPAAAPAASTSPIDTPLHLEALLGQHGVLVADMMRARIRGDADLAQVADAAVSENTKSLGALLQPLWGAQDTDSFAKLWTAHVQMLFNYSRGLSTDDKAVQKDSRAKLQAYEAKLADFFVNRSDGRLPKAAATEAVKMHIDHLLEGADTYKKGDYVASAKLYRESYGHTFDLGATLAHVLLPPSVGKALDTPQAQLRASLVKVLGEHVALVIAAMRSAVGDPKDFAAMGDAVNANTVDLTKAIDSLFGDKAAAGFQSRWADHVDELMAYTSATVNGDDADQEKSRKQLRTFETSFADFLNTATENRLGAKALTQAFVMHDRMLLAEIDAYAAKDYDQAHELSNQTYADMFTVAGQLADAIGATLAEDLPSGGSQTGGGGMARMIR